MKSKIKKKSFILKMLYCVKFYESFYLNINYFNVFKSSKKLFYKLIKEISKYLIPIKDIHWTNVLCYAFGSSYFLNINCIFLQHKK